MKFQRMLHWFVVNCCVYETETKIEEICKLIIDVILCKSYKTE
jgi:hypothetical protein